MKIVTKALKIWTYKARSKRSAASKKAKAA